MIKEKDTKTLKNGKKYLTNVTQYVIILYKQLRSETPKHSQRG